MLDLRFDNEWEGEEEGAKNVCVFGFGGGRGEGRDGGKGGKSRGEKEWGGRREEWGRYIPIPGRGGDNVRV